MKFLILALCVASAAAASVKVVPSWQRAAKASAQVQVVPAVVKTVPEVVVARNTNVGSEVNAEVLRFASDVNADGFNYNYETQNGIVAEASGALKKVDDGEAVAVQGAYQYVSPEGVPVAVRYVADENGYQPQSDLLPVAPAIPEAILRSLEYIRTHAPKIVDKY